MMNSERNITDQVVSTRAPEDMAIVNNDTADLWDHLCGPDPNWGDALEQSGDSHE